MSRWELLFDTLSFGKEPRREFLQAFPEPMQLQFIRHNSYVVIALKNLLRTRVSDEELEKRLRRFLFLRWTLIKNTSLDYTLNPQFPANQACLTVAKAIRKIGEPLCYIIMPTLKRIMGSGLLDDAEHVSADACIEITEDVQGEFHPSLFLTHSREDALMDVAGIFRFSAISTQLLLPTIAQTGESKNSDFDFTETDRARLRECHQTLYDLIHAKHQLQLNANTIGFALRELQVALHQASRQQLGTETKADALAYVPVVRAFYEKWRVLPEDVKQQISRCQIRGTSENNTLGTTLLRLFLDVHLPLHENEINLALNAHAYPCIDLIAGYLDELLKHSNNSHLFEIKLTSTSDSATVMTANDIEAALQTQLVDLSKVLQARTWIAGTEDVRFMQDYLYFSHFTVNLFDSRYVISDIATMIPAINSATKLGAVLRFVDPSYWNIFAAQLTPSFDQQLPRQLPDILDLSTLAHSLTLPGIYYVLEQLPRENWIVFFFIFKGLLTKWFNSDVLALVLNEFKMQDQKILITALDTQIHHIITNVEDLASFFLVTGFIMPHEISERFHLMKPVIEKRLKDPESLAQFYLILRRNALCDSVFQLLQPLIREQINQPQFLMRALQALNSVDCAGFLSRISTVLDRVKLTPEYFGALLNQVSAMDWHRVFIAFGKGPLEKCISNAADLSCVLNKFSSTLQIIFLSQIKKFLPNIRVNSDQLYMIMRQRSVCTEALLTFFDSSLVAIFLELLTSLETANAEKLSVTSLHYNHLVQRFHFFVDKALSKLLEIKRLALHCPSLSRARTELLPPTIHNAVLSVYQQLTAIDTRVNNQESTQLRAYYDKLVILNNFTARSHTQILARDFQFELLQLFQDHRFFERMLDHYPNPQISESPIPDNPLNFFYHTVRNPVNPISTRWQANLRRSKSSMH